MTSHPKSKFYLGTMVTPSMDEWLRRVATGRERSVGYIIRECIQARMEADPGGSRMTATEVRARQAVPPVVVADRVTDGHMMPDGQFRPTGGGGV
jgi:hypothetical protein